MFYDFLSKKKGCYKPKIKKLKFFKNNINQMIGVDENVGRIEIKMRKKNR